MNTYPSIGLLIPTCNGGEQFELVLQSISQQSLQPKRKLVIDSGSADDTAAVAQQYGFEVIKISKEEFNHGATRQWGVDYLGKDVDFIAFLTQDAILAEPGSLQKIIGLLELETQAAMAYGRQLPRANASPIAAHARSFNYPPEGYIYSKLDIPSKGIKAAFASNSFAAYRRDALVQIGGFPQKVILGEDMYVAAKFLLAGWQVAYCAEAKVFHSHNFSIREEGKRYFDIGVFHAQENWLLETLGKSEKEGIRFLLSEIEFLWRCGEQRKIIDALFRNIIKYIGYKLGSSADGLPGLFKKFRM